ncbi:protein SPA [Populus alba x Populus x berolinensis]|uniref:Protein SPA n=1 Tax=Populus alba x Populus x berolinensis TaxID=444605 RepID=A0AAD6W4W6_9ROSI|nr:protein SPA [Populus alba x Populus x berolinensis]
MPVAPSIPRLHSPFLCCHLQEISSSSLSSFKSPRNNHQRSPVSHPCIRAVDLDQNTIVAISVGVVSIAVGIGIPVFYESQIDNAAKRENTQPCFPCSGSGAREQ